MNNNLVLNYRRLGVSDLAPIMQVAAIYITHNKKVEFQVAIDPSSDTESIVDLQSALWWICNKEETDRWLATIKTSVNEASRHFNNFLHNEVIFQDLLIWGNIPNLEQTTNRFTSRTDQFRFRHSQFADFNTLQKLNPKLGRVYNDKYSALENARGYASYLGKAL